MAGLPAGSVHPEPQAGGPQGGTDTRIGTLARRRLNCRYFPWALQVCWAIVMPDLVMSAAWLPQA